MPSAARSDAPRRRASIGALRHRDFALFWTTALVSNSAAWMQMVAVPALLWRLTGSSTWLGAASVASLLPAVLLTPLAGVLADRVSRRLILIVTQICQMVLATAFYVLYVADQLTPWRIVFLLFGTGIVAGIQVAAWQSFIPTLVPREDLIEAVRLNSVQFQAARAIGPGFGAIAVSLFGIGTAFLLNAITFVPVVIAVVVARPRQVMAASAHEPMRHALAEGFQYTWSRNALRRAVMTGLAVSAMGQMVIALAAGISGEIYGHGGTNGNAGLVAALGAGSLVSGVFILARGDRILRSHMALIGLSIYVAGILMIPLTTNYAIGIIAFGVCGLAHIPVATSLNTFVQSAVPDEIRGRVLSFYLLGVMVGMPTGALFFGRLGDAIGLRATILIDGIAFAFFLSMILLRFGRLRFLDADSLDDPEPSAAPPSVLVTGG